MAKELLTRIGLKVDTLAAWNESTIPLLRGEIAIATLAAGAGSGLSEPVIMIKVGEDGVKTFKDLDWAVHAKASDVYGWAKQSEADFVTNFLSLTNGTQTLEQLLDAKFATDAELTKDIAALRTEITNTLANYYTKTEADAAIKVVSDALAAEVTRATGAEAQALTDAKAYTDAEVNKIITGSGYATTTYVDEAVADHEAAVTETLKNYYTKEETDSAIGTDVLIETNRATAAEEALGGRIDAVSAVAEAATTVSEVDAQIDAKITALDLGNTYEAKGEAAKVAADLAEYETANDAAVALKANAADVYTKTEADAAFMTQDEVDARVNKVITDAVEGDTLTSLTELVQYINEHGGDAAEMATAIADLEKMLDGFTVETGAVKTYVDDAIAAIKIGDYAKAADLTALATRVAAIENAPYATQAYADQAEADAKAYADGLNTAMNTRVEALEGAGYATTTQVATAKQEAIDAAAADATTKANAAKDAAIADAVTKYETIGTAQGLVNGLATVYEPIGAETRATTAAKTETENQIAALNISQYETSAHAADTYRKKTDKITSDDLADEVFVFNCGTATTVI